MGGICDESFYAYLNIFCVFLKDEESRTAFQEKEENNSRSPFQCVSDICTLAEPKIEIRGWPERHRGAELKYCYITLDGLLGTNQIARNTGEEYKFLDYVSQITAHSK